MGCDGGTIPKRDELVRKKKEPEKNAKEVENSAKWNYCHLTQEVLQQPIVADLLGYLYNKVALIEKHLLTKSKTGPGYIKSIKDVKELQLTVNPGFKQNQIENGNEFIDLNRSRWICPIIGVEMNGVYKFCYIFTCGCVLSERALKSMQASALVCLKCDKPYTENDLIILNPSEEDLILNEEKLNSRRAAIAAAKPVKAIKTENIETTTTNEATTSIQKTEKKFEETESISSKSSSSSSQKRTHTQAEGVTKTAAAAAAAASNSDSTKRQKTIQDDPNVSSVYKSLFTTSDKAKNQQKAHWVTFNPQYF